VDGTLSLMALISDINECKLADERQPFLATTTEEIKDAAGFFVDTSHGMKHFSDSYLTHSSIEAFNPLLKKDCGGWPWSAPPVR
jgi:hypothetical protein